MNGTSLTALYLKRDKIIATPSIRRKGSGKSLILRGVSGNNLKKIDVEFRWAKLICITGVSGSGKSTLVYDTLYPVLSRHFLPFIPCTPAL